MGTVVDALACPGFVAEAKGQRSGIVTYAEDDEGIEVVYLQVAEPRQGVGTSLLEAVVPRANGRRAWLVTTNDNLDALRFYQRRGFRLVQLRVGAVDDARRDPKPAIRDPRRTTSVEVTAIAAARSRSAQAREASRPCLPRRPRTCRRGMSRPLRWPRKRVEGLPAAPRSFERNRKTHIPLICVICAFCVGWVACRATLS